MTSVLETEPQQTPERPQLGGWFNLFDPRYRRRFSPDSGEYSEVQIVMDGTIVLLQGYATPGRALMRSALTPFKPDAGAQITEADFSLSGRKANLARPESQRLITGHPHFLSATLSLPDGLNNSGEYILTMAFPDSSQVLEAQESASINPTLRSFDFFYPEGRPFPTESPPKGLITSSHPIYRKGLMIALPPVKEHANWYTGIRARLNALPTVTPR